MSRSEVEALGEARVMIVYADRESTRAFGRNPLATTTRAASAAAGQRQGSEAGQDIAAFWR